MTAEERILQLEAEVERLNAKIKEQALQYLSLDTQATALQDEIARLTACLKKANEQAEHFEREWYLRGDEIERLRADFDDRHWRAVRAEAEVARLLVALNKYRGQIDNEGIHSAADAIDAAKG